MTSIRPSIRPYCGINRYEVFPSAHAKCALPIFHRRNSKKSKHYRGYRTKSAVFHLTQTPLAWHVEEAMRRRYKICGVGKSYIPSDTIGPPERFLRAMALASSVARRSGMQAPDSWYKNICPN